MPSTRLPVRSPMQRPRLLEFQNLPFNSISRKTTAEIRSAPVTVLLEITRSPPFRCARFTSRSSSAPSFNLKNACQLSVRLPSESEGDLFLCRMSGNATVTVGKIVELRGGGLSEEEVWSLLCQAVQTLQDLFLCGKWCRSATAFHTGN